jgi:hypothetical protein
MRELWYGMAFQDTKAWLINEDTFWERWNNKNNRLFVFIDEIHFKTFQKRAASYFVLGENQDILLLSNKPTII